MDLGLRGKIVLVTGGSKGIGFACAEMFLAEGARIAICSRSQANVDEACARLPGAFGVSADCAEAGAAQAMLERVEGASGRSKCSSVQRARRAGRPRRSLRRPFGATPSTQNSSRI
jgi:NAD(P)-dependent dehydrogenase (short-subunit alcohol dehydrogenase family)